MAWRDREQLSKSSAAGPHTKWDLQLKHFGPHLYWTFFLCHLCQAYSRQDGQRNSPLDHKVEVMRLCINTWIHRKAIKWNSVSTLQEQGQPHVLGCHWMTCQMLLPLPNDVAIFTPSIIQCSRSVLFCPTQVFFFSVLSLFSYPWRTKRIKSSKPEMGSPHQSTAPLQPILWMS